MVLPQSMRLKGHRCFNYLHKSGTKYFGPSMVLRVVKAKPSLLKQGCKDLQYSTKLAVAISNKVSKKAVIRNRLRRLLHNHLRENLDNQQFESHKWALLSLKPSSIQKEPLPLLQECDKLLHKAGLLR